jgi:hypothetical protein
MRTEQCVCGGTITAPSLSVAAPYIEGHNASPEHYGWRLRNGISRERPTAVPIACDVSMPSARASAAALRCQS